MRNALAIAAAGLLAGALSAPAALAGDVGSETRDIQQDQREMNALGQDMRRA
jgi:hypothetical protein